MFGTPTGNTDMWHKPCQKNTEFSDVNTVDGSEIRRENQLRLAVDLPLIYQGFSFIQPVVGLGISEPSTVVTGHPWPWPRPGVPLLVKVVGSHLVEVTKELELLKMKTSNWINPISWMTLKKNILVISVGTPGKTLKGMQMKTCRSTTENLASVLRWLLCFRKSPGWKRPFSTRPWF